MRRPFRFTLLHRGVLPRPPQFAILLFCVYMFALLVVLLNMLITLMADIYKKVKGVQHFVFLKGTAHTNGWRCLPRAPASSHGLQKRRPHTSCSSQIC